MPHGERYGYWMLKVSALEQKLKVAEAMMCPHCYQRYRQEAEYVKVPGE